MREGLLCTAQDRLPGGISREGSMTGRHELGRGYPNLSAAVRDNWLPSEGLASHPLDEHVADSHMDEPLLADIEDEYEGARSSGWMASPAGTRPPPAPNTGMLCAACVLCITRSHVACLHRPSCPLQVCARPTRPAMSTAMWGRMWGEPTQRLSLSRWVALVVGSSARALGEPTE